MKCLTGQIPIPFIFGIIRPMRKVIKFFDLLEDKIRARLSHYPLIYALIGGTGLILFWRGIWHTADMWTFMSGPISILLGVVILGLTGVLVSALIGNSMIIAGLKGEKKLEEKTQMELEQEEIKIEDLGSELHKIEADLADIKDKIGDLK
jgi:hypothetical protein